jgi:hypothetical protein
MKYDLWDLGLVGLSTWLGAFMIGHSGAAVSAATSIALIYWLNRWATTQSRARARLLFGSPNPS